jgi:hypothetical protein
MKEIFNFFKSIVEAIVTIIIATVAIFTTIGLPLILIFGIPFLIIILLIKLIIKL